MTESLPIMFIPKETSICHFHLIWKRLVSANAHCVLQGPKYALKKTCLSCDASSFDESYASPGHDGKKSWFFTQRRWRKSQKKINWSPARPPVWMDNLVHSLTIKTYILSCSLQNLSKYKMLRKLISIP